MIILVTISFVILVSYVIATVWRWGLPWSISRTYFDIKRKYIFTLVMFASLGLILIPLVEALPESGKVFGILTVFGGFLIGAAPNLNDEHQERVHMTGAAILAVCSQICVGILDFGLLPLWLWCSPFLILGRKHLVFWIEMLGGVLLYACLIFS